MAESIAEVGYLAGVCGDDSGDWEKVGISASNRLQVETESPDGTDLKDLLDKLEEILTELTDIDVDAGVRQGDLSQDSYDGVPGDTDWHTLTEVDGPGILVGLDLVSDHADSAVRVTIDGDALGCPDAAIPQTRVSWIMSDIQVSGGEHTWSEIGVYDTVNDYYTLFLKREIVYNTSLLISYRAGSATADVGLVLQYRGLT